MLLDDPGASFRLTWTVIDVLGVSAPRCAAA
jgi:hypothetical protein